MLSCCTFRSFKGAFYLADVLGFFLAGKVRRRDYFTARRYHEAYQAYAYRRFREEGYPIADFYSMTDERPELVWKPDGVHYGSETVFTQAKIIANMLCNG